MLVTSFICICIGPFSLCSISASYWMNVYLLSIYDSPTDAMLEGTDDSANLCFFFRHSIDVAAQFKIAQPYGAHETHFTGM